jgi:RimJ/RimL family protein N-acetyltransferase
MNAHDFKGTLVQLRPMDLEKDAQLFEKWDRNTEYKRLLDDYPALHYSTSLTKEIFENLPADCAFFMAQALGEDKAIGFIELDGISLASRSAWVGIGIGEAEYWGKGYGTEMMQLVLRYAFRGLNLNRVNLNVFAFNKRAIRSYEKCGFVYEGTQREVIYKEDQRWDIIDMGILREDWEKLNQEK